MKFSRRRVKKSVLVIIAVFVCSCASRKDIIYLQGNEQMDTISQENVFEMLKYKVDDRLTITVSSINPEAASPYNLFATAFNLGSATTNGQQQMQSYLIDSNGEISFPQLGKLKVAGKSRIELEAFIEKKLKPFLPDAKVTVQLVNFRISVLGEVQKPGEFIINREKINVLQALGLAGDLTIYGKRNEIKLIREEDGNLTYYELDIRSKDIFNSPYYYLKQNDVLYVTPNKPKVNASASSPTASYIISATGLIITVISLLTR
ncbi:polysaccharide biosynthesis/export family protein [Ochrovirga pacifica]|uniref:polysaccharide biosynthesis/export family protein n=1 Tax=Ochrovirga pacifica TaxID=1042376 RepID=UPI0002DFC2E4|nr:polysaccharide biosynthesis/export family protein [Ochrovirga pacifica]